MLLNQLIVSGATQRLQEVNKEREYLVKLIDKYSHTKVVRLKIKAPKIRATAKGKSYKGKHWTQLPENKARVAKWMKKMQKAKRIKDANSK